MAATSKQSDLRQRAGAKAKAEPEKPQPGNPETDVKKSAEEPAAGQKSVSDQRTAFLTISALFLLLIANILRISSARGWGFVFGLKRSLDLTPEQWQQTLRNHTTVMIGGEHRSGTQFLWRCLREHDQITSFGEKSGREADQAEGMLLHNVYPKWGIGVGGPSMFSQGQGNLKVRIARGVAGIGAYALAPEDTVHLTETDERVNPTSQAELLNAFGYHWDLKKPVLLETTAANAVMTRFLQALLNLGNSAWEAKQPDGVGESVVRFIFISRDPLANALALEGVVDKIELRTLVENWLAVHEYFMSDKEHLQHARILRLEDFVESPASHLRSLWEWMGLEVPSGMAEDTVERLKIIPKPNQKYMVKYCSKLVKGGKAKVDAHVQLVNDYNDRIKSLDLGYDLGSWCTEASHYKG
mmetsp:Transcript_16035/g.34845  ORF Transcript_16035/g.34845 Transcript_16035/m.34845 type:complete len:413 (-) Transcript_16035:58-1296(-)|eukprot:CAMPEP_0118936042 /NCGR_PEP_ID=MMETSP1169-20130426/15971_1 /TAXON_ID=36882 /ORGANISM="Pyramimonas obovata, Strain CCMP722" /LENGTH=412 /DNA_ID=CAMNT_0006879139 /DNA_START=262 /DNA_END=1500 /DNA_ORIENTATION=+